MLYDDLNYVFRPPLWGKRPQICYTKIISTATVVNTRKGSIHSPKQGFIHDPQVPTPSSAIVVNTRKGSIHSPKQWFKHDPQVPTPSSATVVNTRKKSLHAQSPTVVQTRRSTVLSTTTTTVTQTRSQSPSHSQLWWKYEKNQCMLRCDSKLKAKSVHLYF